MASARTVETIAGASLRARRSTIDVRVALAIATIALTAGAVAVAVAGAERDRVLVALMYALLVATPMCVGLLSWRSQPDARFAKLLVAVGAMFAVTSLAESSNDALYSLGRTSVWVAEAALIILMLSFPSGRLATGLDRRLAFATVGLVATLWLPTALVIEQFPEPSPWARCIADCPANAFAITEHGAGVVDDVIRPMRELLTVLLTAGVAVALARRMRRGAPMLRRVLAPVVGIAVLQLLEYGAYFLARRPVPDSDVLEPIGWIYVFTLPAVALSFAGGLLNRRLYVASVLERLSTALRAPASAHELRTALAQALEDQSLRITYWLPGEGGGWVDERGSPAAPPEAGAGRAITEVGAGSRRIAAVVHDEALAPDSKLVKAASSYGLVVLENTRLIGELRSSLRRLSDTEARAAAIAEGERRRIERDLHDGAQQRLVALRINLALLSERLDREAPERAAELEELAWQVDHAIEEVRSLAHGVHPTVLAEEGLAAALRAAARESPLHARVEANGVGRLAPEVESAAYFCCIEALQNAVKHAHEATGVTIAVAADGRLRFEVRDDGSGFDRRATPGGAGLANMRDRVASVGGWLTVESQPGQGTTVMGMIPIA